MVCLPGNQATRAIVNLTKKWRSRLSENVIAEFLTIKK